MPGTTFISKYPGRCAACGDWFAAGTEITGVGGGDYVEADCDKPMPEQAHNPVCKKCFTERSNTGACACSE